MVVELLTPQQAADFLIATAELQYGIHCWGRNQDLQRGNSIQINRVIITKDGSKECFPSRRKSRDLGL
ncbi:conserved hypothetical protein [Ricinus communis]|uniref:Uncharacterized protein n=1 Tax=Ricinus communis TaxID=3988 RepID=B9SEW8_RICCO|nr:conserved hypothetical protein [Ricinus communis]